MFCVLAPDEGVVMWVLGHWDPRLIIAVFIADFLRTCLNTISFDMSDEGWSWRCFGQTETVCNKLAIKGEDEGSGTDRWCSQSPHYSHFTLTAPGLLISWSLVTSDLSRCCQGQSKHPCQLIIRARVRAACEHQQISLLREILIEDMI